MKDYFFGFEGVEFKFVGAGPLKNVGEFHFYVVGEFCGTSRVVSSAYLRITLPGERGLRSFAYTCMMYRQGPIPDPCTILAVIDFQ